MTFTQEQVNKEMARIQQSIPRAWLDYVVSETHLTPTIKDVVEKAIEDKDFPEEKKKQLLHLKEMGYFDKKIVRQNEKIAKMIDEYVTREIKKSVKAGRLPTKKQLKELTKQNDKTKTN